ncbi:hypothetical protein [Escherichia phage 18-1-2]|nr:hypothetical protein [Escherichia phage 18-1-2]UJQ87382.1 hypothetical protein [Escherichia phage 24-2-1]UJQ87549.1 hypothetical protein [Escherichia phage 19-1-2]UOX40144.1 hypothetical protein [Escherichia phage vB_EcoM_TH18]
MLPTTEREITMALKKLTSNTRWDEIGGEVYIFTRKPGDQK